MDLLELKNSRVFQVPAGDRSGSLSASIRILLGEEALTMREICEKLKYEKAKSLSGTLLQMKKRGLIVSFYVEGKNDQFFLSAKKAEDLGIGFE